MYTDAHDNDVIILKWRKAEGHNDIVIEHVGAANGSGARLTKVTKGDALRKAAASDDIIIIIIKSGPI